MMDATVRPPSEPKPSDRDDLVVLLDLAQWSSLLAARLREHPGGCEMDTSDPLLLEGAQSQLVQISRSMAIALAELPPHPTSGEHAAALIDLRNCVGLITYLLGRAKIDQHALAECLNDLGDKSATMFVQLAEPGGARRRGVVSS